MGCARHAVQGEGQLTLADSAGQVGAFQGQLRGVTKKESKDFPWFFFISVLHMESRFFVNHL